MADILFVCVRKDLARADALAERLRSLGYSIGEVAAGDAGLARSAAGVLLWSHAARLSPPFRETAHRLIKADRAVFASLIRFPSPSALGGSSSFDLSAWNGDPADAALAPLCSAISHKVGDHLCEQALRWRSIRNSRTASDFLDYIDRYGPDGAFSRLAEQRMKERASEGLRAALRKPSAWAEASAPEFASAGAGGGGGKSACGVSVAARVAPAPGSPAQTPDAPAAARPAAKADAAAPPAPDAAAWVASISRTGPAFAPAKNALLPMSSFDGEDLPEARATERLRAGRRRLGTERSNARPRRAFAEGSPGARRAQRVAAVLIPLVVGVALSGAVYFGGVTNTAGLSADARAAPRVAGAQFEGGARSGVYPDGPARADATLAPQSEEIAARAPGADLAPSPSQARPAVARKTPAPAPRRVALNFSVAATPFALMAPLPETSAFAFDAGTGEGAAPPDGDGGDMTGGEVERVEFQQVSAHASTHATEAIAPVR
jgi:hypothetical protein